MKLLVSEPGRRVVQLTPRERQEMRAVLHALSGVRRPLPSLTRGDAAGLPGDAAALLSEEVASGREAGRVGALGLLEDPLRCVEGRGGYGLHVTDGEAEGLLQALNGARVAFWEALGGPDFESGERVEDTERNRMLVTWMEVAGVHVGRWLACMGGDGGTEE